MKKIFTLVAMAAMAISANAQEIWDAASLKSAPNTVDAEKIVKTENTAKNVVFRSQESPLDYPGVDGDGNPLATDAATVVADGKSTEKLYDYVITGSTNSVTLKAICTPNLGEEYNWQFGLNTDPSAEGGVTNNRALNTDACDPKFIDYIKAKSGNCADKYIDWYEYNSDGELTHKVSNDNWTPKSGVKPAMGSWFELTPAVAGTLKVGLFINKNIQNNKLYIAVLNDDQYHFNLLAPEKVSVWGWINNNGTEDFFNETPLQSDYRIIESTTLQNPFLGYVTFDVEANKTYMLLSPQTQLGLYGFYFAASGESGITNLKAEQQSNAPIFNLAGQQVDKSYKGVVIQNGRKLIQK